jgi:carbamoyltransferase
MYGCDSFSDPMTKTHESLSRDETLIAGSDRSFGIVMAAAFAVLALLNGWHGGHLWPWTGGLASLFLAAAFFFEVLDEDRMIETTAKALAGQQAVGWFQGRMEFGPRALGARSILADPRSPTMQRNLNLKVKYRESFRPFAPSILREDVSNWFELDFDSPYMLIVADVRKDRRSAMSPEEQALFGIDKLNVVRSEIPAVTHVNYSARIQTVHAATNPMFHRLLQRFKALTGCPILVNTSFNVRGEPIVCTPEDAFRCFMGCELDLLAIGNCVLRKTEQDASLKGTYNYVIEPD